MKRFFVIAAAVFAMLISNTAFAEAEITVIYNGEEIVFTEEPVIVSDKTLVQLRPIAEAMELEIGFENGQVFLSDENTTVAFTQNSLVAKINDEEVLMDVPMVIKNNYTFVPVRDLAEPFGCILGYDGATRTVTIERNLKKEISIGSGEYEAVHFYQSQPDLALENNGRGYCWVCSYAMLFSNATKTVITPLEIAQYNIDAGYNGNFMAGHSTLANHFGLKLVPALSDTSTYYQGFNTKNKGETTLNIATDEDAAMAIREALDNFPYGVIVRYDGYPHSMMAVSYDENGIYFNDPGMKNGEHVTFENTCLKKYKLSDISYIQAVEVK